MFETQYMLVPSMAFPGSGEHRSAFCSPGEAKLGSSGFVGSWDDFYVQLYSIYIPRIGNDRKGSIYVHIYIYPVWFFQIFFIFHNIWDVILPIDYFSRWLEPPTRLGIVERWGPSGHLPKWNCTPRQYSKQSVNIV